MALDPYALCPCGSGKKSKFCCLDISADMEKVGRLKANGQTAQALRAVEKVREKHPDSPWGITTQAALLNDSQRFADARDVLVALLRAEPAHPLGNALYAMTEFNLTGWPDAKKIIHRAFKACLKHRPDAVYSLANAVAHQLIDDDEVMAGRQHLAVAMRFAPQEVRQQVFIELMELDGDSSQFFPFRGPYSLHTQDVPEAVKPAFEKAMRVASIGCYAEAAESIQGLIAEGDWGDDSVPVSLHGDLGLLHAWDGNIAAAGQALRDAAANTDDVDQAAEWLALAALLEIQNGDDSAPLMARLFRTDELGKAASAFSESPRLVKAESVQENAATLFLVLDRDEPESYDASTSLDDVVKIIARVSIVDVDIVNAEGEPRPQVTVFGVDNGELADAISVVETAAPGLLNEVEKSADERTLGRVSAEIEAIRWEPYFPPKTPGSIRRAISSNRWQKVFDDIWPETPAAALGGETPSNTTAEQAAKQAALIVLDAICDTHRVHAPLEDLRARYEIDEPTPLEVTDELPLNTLTTVQLMRVPMAALSDDQARLLLQRAVLTGHSRFASEALEAAIERGLDLASVIEEERAYQMLADMAQQALDFDAAIGWITKARQALVDDRMEAGDPREFEQRLRWKLSELSFRLDSPHEEPTLNLLRELWDSYGPKLPEVREHLKKIVVQFEIEPPWSDVVIVGAEATADTGAQKLWLPGQD